MSEAWDPESPQGAAVRPTFVIGTGRCGSTLLSEMLHLHPRVLSISEWFTVLGETRALEDSPTDAATFWRLLTVPSTDAVELLARHPEIPELRIPIGFLEEYGMACLPPILTIPLPRIGADSQQMLAALHTHLGSVEARTLSDWHLSAFRFLAGRQGKRLWLERSGGSLAYADSLRRSWPDARYIHIYRDGIDCAISMARHPYFRVRVARSLARSRLTVRECLQTDLPLEQFGAYWSAVIMRGLRALAGLADDDVLHIAYSALVEQPERQLRRVQAFLEGATQANDWLASASALTRLSDRRGAAVNPKATERLRRACRPGMAQLSRLVTHTTE